MDGPVTIKTTVAGKWGPIFVAATDRGVVSIAWLFTDEAFDAAIIRRLGGRVAFAGSERSQGQREKHLANGVKWVEAFLSGRPARNGPPIDLADRPRWDQRVLAAVATIPWGRTESYAEIARRVGSPRATQAVGGAIGRNPILFLVPCHRVIASDGSLGGWGGDRWGDQRHRLRNKADLLQREGVTIAPPGG